MNCQMCWNNNGVKVRDHSHDFGHFRGTCHRYCNLKYGVKKTNWVMPFFMHNLRSYDSHLLLRAVKPRHGRVRIIPTNFQKVLAMQVGRVLFLDSMQFGLQSLDKLVQSLENGDFVETKKEFGKKAAKLFSHCHTKEESLDTAKCGLCSKNRDIERVAGLIGTERYVHHCHREYDDVSVCEWCNTNKRVARFDLIRAKGVFCYDEFTDMNFLNSTKLPDQSGFDSSLYLQECSDLDYWKAEQTWKTFDMLNMRDFHNHYLKTDVLLLMDFFEKFRAECLDSYGLDAAHYFSAPGLAFDAALKMTGICLEQLSDGMMYEFFEKGIRGGVSQISKRYARANNPTMAEYNPDEELSSLIYIDCNNLYGKAMSESLPYRDFKWLNDDEIAMLPALDKISDDGPYGYAMEVDLIVP